MLAATQSSPAAVAAAAAPATPADPWDAPYFGGPVYFRYHDSRGGSHAARVPANTRAQNPALSAPAALATDPSPATESSKEPEASTPVSPSAANRLPATRNRSWVTRLLGRLWRTGAGHRSAGVNADGARSR
jgi:hypothetical protein